MSSRLFIRKGQRPDITKITSDHIYFGHDAASETEDLAVYPGLALKGCSKDGTDGKEGSDGKEACDGSRAHFSFDDLGSTRLVNLDTRFKPRIVRPEASRLKFHHEYNP